MVDADVPMLLSKNILKPLGASIDLFETGGGMLRLNGVEIKLKISSGGHYKSKVSDLGKTKLGPYQSEHLSKADFL